MVQPADHPEIPAAILRAYPPAPDPVLNWLCLRISRDMLVDISQADYAIDAEKHLQELQAIWRRRTVPASLGWEPREVLELIRWSEPEDPSWTPGGKGKRGHLMRAFACAVLVRAAAEDPDAYGGENQTLAQLVASALTVGEELTAVVGSVLAWRLPQLQREQERPFFAYGLLVLSVFDPQPKLDATELAGIANWVVREEQAEREALGDVLVGDDRWLLGLTCFDLKHDTWRQLAGRVRERAQNMDEPARTALTDLTNRILNASDGG